MPQDEKLTPTPSDDFTIPSRKRRLDDVTHFGSDEPSAAPESLPKVAPWVLQHYFDGEIDLIKELVGRFPQLPVMSLITLREVGVKNKRGVASMSTQDGAAGLIAEVDGRSRAVQFTFVLSSMLALRFCPGKLTDMDRNQWLDPIRRETGEPAFLWEQTRWENDYLIGAAQKNFTNLFAFSPNHIEAAARLTPEVTRKLLDWLQFFW
jgi:hypothetical protein